MRCKRRKKCKKRKEKRKKGLALAATTRCRVEKENI